MQIFNMPKGSKLYRYDLAEPPHQWSIEHKNPEYQYNSKSKNQFGGFFFFNSLYQAVGTCKAAFDRYKREYQCAWLTECETICDVSLLDLRMELTISATLLDLYKGGIDIFNDNFHVYSNKGPQITFSIFKKDIESFAQIVEVQEWYRNKEKNRTVDDFIYKIEQHFIANDNVGLLGQRLTDLENGILFSNLLRERQRDGYIFNEANRQEGTDTVCLINSDVLSSPKCQKYDNSKIEILFEQICK